MHEKMHRSTHGFARIKLTESQIIRIATVVIVLGFILLGISIIGNIAPTSTPTPTQTPTPIPTPTSTPTPTPRPRTSGQSNAGTGCAQFNANSGQSTVTITLVTNGGSVTGDTVVRLIPTGSCPGESASQEHWMSSGETSWTTGAVNPGRYRIEIANGYYQGVISRNVDLVSGHYQMSITVVN